MASDYWNSLMLNRQRLLWAIATRRQLGRWEPFVAESVRRGFESRSANKRRQLDDADIWAAEIERHLLLVSARNLFHALELDPSSQVVVDPVMRAELIEARDLLEHWRENVPIFNVRPRTVQPPRRSGRDFAARNPDRGPYSWTNWKGQEGAMVTPHVGAPALHELLDAVEAEVIASDQELRRFLPPPAESPWIRDGDGLWWPKPPI